MPIIPNRPPAQNKYRHQDVVNSSYDEDYGVQVFEPLGHAGNSLQRLNADNLQIYSTTSGAYQYFCFAAPGVTQATAGWMIFRLDSAANKMYADGDANFDNVATDPASLNYTYG